MQVAQIPQRCLILFAHPFGKPRIIQPLIPRELRHILQHAQSLPDRLPPLLGHLPPLRQHVVPDVALLLRSQLIPAICSILQFLSLRRRKIPKSIIVLEDFLPLLRRQVAEFSLRLRRRVGGRRTVRIAVRIRARARHGIRPVRAVSLRIAPATVRPASLLRGFRRILRWVLLPLRCRLSLWRRMLLRPSTRAAALREASPGQHCAEPHRQQTSCELESKFH
jgi:hypothetical protein